MSTTVQIVSTANPAILKFTSEQISVNGSYEYNNIDEAKNSQLAQQLFYLPFVKKIYVTANFIAIERFDIVAWEDVQNEVREQIEAYLKEGGVIINDEEKTGKKTAIEVYAETTPNPAVQKFVSNKRLTSKSYEFKNIDEAKDAPIAIELFKLPFVKEVFISENYISITKFEVAEWPQVTADVRSFIRNYIADGNVLVKESAKAVEEKSNISDISNLDETSQKIISILEEYVRPAVASDGGNIQFASYNADNKVVEVVLQGACSGCPSSTLTLKSGIETMLKQMIPNKIESVVAING
ncbi:NifU family protein [Urechidicola sp. KH5]